MPKKTSLFSNYTLLLFFLLFIVVLPMLEPYLKIQERMGVQADGRMNPLAYIGIGFFGLAAVICLVYGIYWVVQLIIGE